MDEKLSAMLTGLIGVTAVNVIRRDDDNNNRIRNQQDDLDSLSRLAGRHGVGALVGASGDASAYAVDHQPTGSGVVDG